MQQIAMAHHSITQELRNLARPEITKGYDNPSRRLLSEILAEHPELELNPKLKLNLAETGTYILGNVAGAEVRCDKSSIRDAIKPLENDLSSEIGPKNLPEDMIGTIHSKIPVVKPLGKAIWDSTEDEIGDFVRISAPRSIKGRMLLQIRKIAMSLPLQGALIDNVRSNTKWLCQLRLYLTSGKGLVCSNIPSG